MIEMPPKEASANELYSDFETEKQEIRHLLAELNDKAWVVVGEDNITGFDQMVKMRNEFTEDQIADFGVTEPAKNFAAYHYFIGSGLPAGTSIPFDTEDGVVIKSIKTAAKYFGVNKK